MSLRTKRLILGGAVAGVVAVVLFLFWFFNRTTPDAVDLEAAVSGVSGTITTASDTPTVLAGDRWVVDTGIGEFAFAEATGSFAGFRVEEILDIVGAATAVGRTPLVSGEMVITEDTVMAATIKADLTGIVSNDSRRERAIQRTLETSEFPTATFVLTDPVVFGGFPADGSTVEFDIRGELTVRDTAHDVTIPMQVQVVGESIIVVGSLDIVFADYGLKVPESRFVLSAEDHGILEMQLWFRLG